MGWVGLEGATGFTGEGQQVAGVVRFKVGGRGGADGSMRGDVHMGVGSIQPWGWGKQLGYLSPRAALQTCSQLVMLAQSMQ